MRAPKRTMPGGALRGGAFAAAILGLALVPVLASAGIIGSTPTITTSASANVMLGGQVSDSATVTERGGGPIDARGGEPGGSGPTIVFRLYGPNDASCAGAPVFQSPAVAYPDAGGPVNSPAFTPTQPGTYRWRATYSGDRFNNPVTGACDAANENVLVTVGPPPPPAPPPAPPPPPSPGGPKCLGATATIVVAPGQTIVEGTAGRDVIVGGDANETINGRGGNDVICAGNGDDVARGGDGDDKILGDVGDDKLFGRAGDDLLLGGAGKDDLRGGSGSDRTGGNGGKDHVDGGSGNDMLNEQKLGGKGVDQLFGGPGDDRVRTAGGTGDEVDCGPGDDSANLDAFDDEVRCEETT